MGCRIAENRPLMKLSEFLGLEPACHSAKPRESCIHQLPERTDIFKGAQGSAIGWCNALFKYEGNIHWHTSVVMEALNSIDAPMPCSHEIFWGYKQPQNEPAAYLEKAMMVLQKNDGRIPVVITGFNPERDSAEIDNLFFSRELDWQTDTMLVRILIDKASISATINLLRRIIDQCVADKRMPRFYPLLQSGSMIGDDWQELWHSLGELAQFANVAINPFVHDDDFEVLSNRITVAQIPIGLDREMFDDGTIMLPDEMEITGAEGYTGYNLFEYFDRLSTWCGESPPTLIVLGPSQPGWDIFTNKRRIAAFLPLLKQGLSGLWKIPDATRESILSLAA